VLRLAGLLALTITALLALTAASASAAPPAQFGTEGSGAGQINEPRGIAVDQQSGDLYIADRNNNRIDKFGFLANFLRALVPGFSTGAPA
jgi:DNA-binding beta-propeller fold protein YncE